MYTLSAPRECNPKSRLLIGLALYLKSADHGAMVMITQEVLKDLFTYDETLGSLTRKSTGTSGCLVPRKNKFYLQTRVSKKTYYTHRLVWMYLYGTFPINEIDHINGDGTDNRSCNLREVTRSQNCKNTRLGSRNRSGFQGVGWHKSSSKWRAHINNNGQQVHLGLFDSLIDAVAARIRALTVYGYHTNHGDQQ